MIWPNFSPAASYTREEWRKLRLQLFDRERQDCYFRYARNWLDLFCLWLFFILLDFFWFFIASWVSIHLYLENKKTASSLSKEMEKNLSFILIFCLLDFSESLWWKLTLESSPLWCCCNDDWNQCDVGQLRFHFFLTDSCDKCEFLTHEPRACRPPRPLWWG